MGTEIFLAENEVRLGGAAGIAALALQGLGTPLHLHAHVGQDLFGDLLVQELAEIAGNLPRVPESTAYSVGITHPGGERTFFTHLGHLTHFNVRKVQQILTEAPPSYLLLCGYFIMPPLRTAATIDLLKAAKAHGHTTLLDTGWPSEGFTPAVTRELYELVPHVDFVLPNEIEATSWTGQGNISQAIRILADWEVQPVVKRGPAGASWWEDGAVQHLPAPQVRVADTVGAGDSFNAAFMTALYQNQSMSEAVSAAIAYTSLVISERPRKYPALSEVQQQRD